MKEAVRQAWLRGISRAADTHKAFRLRDEHKHGLRPIDVFNVINDLEVPLVFEPLDKLLGTYVRVESTTVGILVNSQRPLHMQRFTAAHELGHFVCEHEKSFDREMRMPGHTANRPLEEVEADAFAAEFLMPKWLLRATAQRRGWWSGDLLADPDVVYQLSLRLSVSYEAACWGLVASEYIARDVGEELATREPKQMKQRALRGVQMRDSWADVWLLDESDNGAHLDAGPNDVFIIELEEHASSGYRWDVEKAVKHGFSMLSDGSQSSDVKIGGRAIRRLVFGGPPKGVHEFQLDHRRSFSKRDEPQTFYLSVSTRGPVKSDDAMGAWSAPSIH